VIFHDLVICFANSCIHDITTLTSKLVYK